MLDNPFSEDIFPNIQSKPPLMQLEAISSCPMTCYLGEETNTHLSTTSFRLYMLSMRPYGYLCTPSLEIAVLKVNALTSMPSLGINGLLWFKLQDCPNYALQGTEVCPVALWTHNSEVQKGWPLNMKAALAWRSLPARDNRGEDVGSRPSLAEKGGLNKGLPDPEGAFSSGAGGTTQTLLGATGFRSGRLPTYPRGSLHKTKLPVSCLGSTSSVPGKNASASAGSPPCQGERKGCGAKSFKPSLCSIQRCLPSTAPIDLWGHLWHRAAEAGLASVSSAEP
ncbi:hypothetical protein QYF61_007607, partial [Mycteria americana]